ncbi:MAG TPA: family 78 glycoside hydrolase catalytic domain [Terriglobia bacterium]|nr:family 78 glycoside hydrolase catalytic domain [Terriglobia bacterium]
MMETKTIWRMVFLVGLLAFASATVDFAPASDGPQPPSNLRCEYLTNPGGIDVIHPRFSWVLEHGGRGETQTAYQVLVTTRPDSLQKDKGEEWDSGHVASDDSTQVEYKGKPLESGQTYYWKVKYWDKEGNASAYSRTAKFGMGLLSREDWKGQWIGGANQLRTEFQLPEGVVRARAYISGLGYYELRINGEKVGRNVLDPAWTTYDKRVLYSTYNVTRRLRSGANAVGVMLGQGWYGSRALLLQINVELANGKRMSVVSGPQWKARNGPITSDSVYDGETYDARLETPGWDQPGFDDSAWAAADVVEGPQGTLSAQMMPPIRVVDTLVPVSIANPEPGVYVYDMGQNMSGWARLRVRGPRGAMVSMSFAELIYNNGMINRENIRGAKSRDIYTLRGGGEDEVYEPRFTYHGFRYVEVRGFPGTPSLDSVRGRVVHSSVGTVGSFVASKQILNQIQKLIHWSQLTNLFGIPTDCDQRDERQGWMGDAQVTAEEAMLNFDMAAFYTNFIRDIHDTQSPEGMVPDTVPHRYGRAPADPAWGTAYPQLCWYMWQQYGDRRILEENYEGLKKYVEYLRSRASDNILSFSSYGDWVALENTPGEYVSDAYYYYDVEILAGIARVLGKTADAGKYSQLAGQIKEAFNRKFYDPAKRQYANGTQTADAMALNLDLATPDHRGAAAGNLTNDIVYRHDTHVTTGFIGVKHLMEALTKIGRTDLAYDLATQTTYPSWGYMISRGATTLWELWQEKTGPSMNSHDHAMFGSVGAWFYRALAGINLNQDSVGYRHIRIEPQMVRDLTQASGSVETIRGTVSSSWTHTRGTITLEVAIPVGSDAQIVMRKDDDTTGFTITEGSRTVFANGHYISGTEGITGANEEKSGVIIFNVGSGTYSFKLKGE